MTYRKINLKWIKELSIRSKTIKFWEENIEGKLHNVGSDNDFLDVTPEIQVTKEKKR